MAKTSRTGNLEVDRVVDELRREIESLRGELKTSQVLRFDRDQNRLVVQTKDGKASVQVDVDDGEKSTPLRRDIDGRGMAIRNVKIIEAEELSVSKGTINIGRDMQIYADGADIIARTSVGAFPISLFGDEKYGFPVGSIFITVSTTTPKVLLGYGTWAAFAAGKMLIGLNAGDADFDNVEGTGGAKTHTHGAGTIATSAHAGTAVADHAVHNHNVPASGTAPVSVTVGVGEAAAKLHTHTTDNNSAAQSHTVTQPSAHTISGSVAATTIADLPPYVVVYMWERVA